MKMNDINLIPEEYVSKKKSKKKYLGALIVIILILFISAPFLHLNYLENKLTNIEDEKKRLEAEAAHISEMNEELEKLEEKLEELSAIESSNLGELTADIFSEIPQGIVINSLSADQNTLSLEGYCRSISSAGILVNKLNNIDNVENANLQAVERDYVDNIEVINFTISCDVLYRE